MERGMGWRPDLPDVRDLDVQSDVVTKMLAAAPPVATPALIDLRTNCSPIENQGQIGSCCAHAAVSMYEYFERKAFKKHIDGSRLFVYRTMRKLLGWTGDSGGELRAAMKALVLFGLPPEQYWPYQPTKYDEEPPAFVYALGSNFQALTYYRLDPSGVAPTDVLTNVKSCLAGGRPAMFGFTVYNNIDQADGTGRIPMPAATSRADGGHAVLAVGYDDNLKIGASQGALLIQNSWGTSWGDKGFGWLPYDYVRRGLADDFWSLIKAEYVDFDKFT